MPDFRLGSRAVFVGEADQCLLSQQQTLDALVMFDPSSR